MVKLSSTFLEGLEGIENRTQLYHDYGALMIRFGRFELALEVAIARLTRMTNKNAAIVLGGLVFGAKAAILFALLSQAGRRGHLELVRDAITAAKRNALIHGPLGNDNFDQFTFYHREVGTAYKVKAATFSADEFHAHYIEFDRAAERALLALGVSGEAVDRYASAAQFDLPAQSRHPTHPRLEHRDSLCTSRPQRSGGR